jgi:hypothetical protein
MSISTFSQAILTLLLRTSVSDFGRNFKEKVVLDIARRALLVVVASHCDGRFEAL